MGMDVQPENARRRSGAARASFARAWGCAAAPALGCARESAVRLPLDAPLPETFSKSTELQLGDPLVQKQLDLTGGLAGVPFAAGWQNLSGGPQTIEAFRAGALDGGAVGDTPPIHAIFTGLDVKIVAVQVRDNPGFQLALAPGVQVAALEELRGKSIAYSPGQAQGALVLRVLAKAGLAQSEVWLVQPIACSCWTTGRLCATRPSSSRRRDRAARRNSPTIARRCSRPSACCHPLGKPLPLLRRGQALTQPRWKELRDDQ